MSKGVRCPVGRSIYLKEKNYKYHSCSDSPFDYLVAKKETPARDRMLKLTTGHAIEVLKRQNMEWWYGRDRITKEEGWFLTVNVAVLDRSKEA